jgi:guanylate kinase
MSSERGSLTVVSAASGSGKSTLVDMDVSRVPNVERVVTTTTRSPRGAETDGVDYHFLSVEEFERRIAAGDFLEYARVHGSRLYGTSRQTVEERLAAGVDLLLVIDVQGAAEVRRRMPESESVFVLPPSYGSLVERLRRRCEVENHTDEEDFAARLVAARDEVARYSEFDYVIINDDLERAANALAGIVQANRYRTVAQRRRIDEIVRSFEVGGMHARFVREDQ